MHDEAALDIRRLTPLLDDSDRSELDPQASPDRRINARTILLIIVALLFVVFLFQNAEEVQVDFLFVDVRAPLWLAIAVAGALGLIAGWLIGRFDLGPGRVNKQR